MEFCENFLPRWKQTWKWISHQVPWPGIRAAIHCAIVGQPISRSINILNDVEFTQANKMFEVVCKSYYKRGNPKPQHKNPIKAGDMEKLNWYFSNDCPDKLQEFVWFNLCYYLGRRGREGWRELTKNSLEFKHNDQDKEYMYVTIKHTKQNKNNQGGSKQKDQDYTDMRMYGLPGSSMDPISFDLSWLGSPVSDSVDKVLQGGRVLVQEQALGKQFHRPIYGQGCTFPGTYPGLHSTLRKGVHYQVTRPHEAGVDAKQICAITNFKNEQSLTSS